MLESIKELRMKLEEKISEASQVFIIGHDSPDFDSIGSAIGLCTYVESFGKKAYIIVNDDPFKIEPGVKKIIDKNRARFRIINNEEFLALVDDQSLLIATDVNKASMISIRNDFDKVGSIIVIDHHSEDETTLPTEDRYNSQEVSSASEVVTRILNHSKIPYDPDVANYLLAGISLDTKNFVQSTTDKTHEVAEKLLKNGADIDFVNNLFLEEFESFCRISDLIINGTIIKKYSKSLLAPIQVSFTLNRNKPEHIYLKEDYAKAADRMMKFNGIDAAFTLGYVEPGIVHISARSGKRVNVKNIMIEMGGGGKLQAAGGRIENADVLKVEKELMKKIPVGLSEEDCISEEPQVIKIKQRNGE